MYSSRHRSLWKCFHQVAHQSKEAKRSAPTCCASASHSFRRCSTLSKRLCFLTVSPRVGVAEANWLDACRKGGSPTVTAIENRLSTSIDRLTQGQVRH